MAAALSANDFLAQGAREEAGNLLDAVILSWRDDLNAQVWAHFKGFEIVSRGSAFKDDVPELFVRGREIYKAINPANPVGTISSIEHVVRNLDRRAEEEQGEIERQGKALTEYRTQLGRAFEHEARLKELLLKQAQLNACLDLDKHDAQIVDDVVGGPQTRTSDIHTEPRLPAQTINRNPLMRPAAS
jgi:hypothetical protein